MTNQTLHCREAFEKWHREATGHDVCDDLSWPAWQAAWNTSAQSSAPETERTVKDCLTVATTPDGGEAASLHDREKTNVVSTNCPEISSKLVDGGEAVAWASASALSEITPTNARTVNLYGFKPSPRNKISDHVPLYTRSNAQGGEFSLVERIASDWDGCLYEGIGEDIDIGQAIREAALSAQRGEKG